MTARYPWLAAIVIPCALATAALAGIASQPPTALACTGGWPGGPIEAMANVSHIAIVQASAVGSAKNTAPTVTPQLSPTPTSTHDSAFPPVRTPASPPVASPTPVPPSDFVLEGIGVTFSLLENIAGSPAATIEHGWTQRRDIEEALRQGEGGRPVITSCELDRFLPRYMLGRTYLLFYAHTPVFDDLFPFMTFPIDGTGVVLDDPEHMRAFSGVLLMMPDTYHRYFEGLAFENWGEGDGYHIAEPRVDFARLIGAVRNLRGDPSIAPPDAGSAGLKDVAR